MSEKEAKKPLILEIKGNSLDDGPGIRSVVFFKGCPLSCVWCHNPESKKAVQEIYFDETACVGCGMCREVCPMGALSPDNPVYIDRSKCNLCFLCVDQCPACALSRVGVYMSIDDIVQKVLPDKPFFDNSGGGVTLSGGEPTLYPGFSSKLLKGLKAKHMHTLLETCGYFEWNRFVRDIYPFVDAIYFDIKLIDSREHKEYCKVPNETILDNFYQLAQIAEKDNKILLPRIPLIPGITDTDHNMEGIANFLEELKVKKAALLTYNPLWHEKAERLGADDPYRNDSSMKSFPDKESTERCSNIIAQKEISLV